MIEKMLRAKFVITFLSVCIFCINPSSYASNKAANSPDYIWWEAEDTLDDNFPRQGAFDPSNESETEILSNGRWLNIGGGEPSKHFAHYSISVKKTATYHLYARKFWYHGNFRYRFNDEKWKNIKRKNHPLLLDAVEIREHVTANWVYLGMQHLTQGTHRFELELLSSKKGAAFDSFVLSDALFTPLGLRKPDEKLNIKENDSWSFEPDIDSFSKQSLWDLRSLNEDIAGMNGYVRRSEDGNQFVLGDGTPVRFWAMNSDFQESPNLNLIDYHGRHLAKRGFNMVRLHGLIESKTEDLFAPDPLQMEYSWRLVASMKKHGIYTTLSAYWGTHAKSQAQWQELKGNENGTLDGLLFFEPTLQKAYKGWLKQWLTTPNPYTGIPLAKDPAVAIFQIQNEDSLLFWTTRNIAGEHLERLEQRFTQWAIARYGNLDKLKASWGRLKEKRDSNKPHLTLLPIYELTQTNKGKRKQRLDDQYAFLIDVMSQWNQEVERFLREEVGYQGLINAGNWRTANDEILLDGERLSYSHNQVMAKNRYYSGGKHFNPNKKFRASYRVEKGDFFEGQSILFHPDELPVNIKQIDGYPMIVSESTWSNPNSYQAEAPFLIASYSSLSDIDGYYWFASGDNIGFANRTQKFPASSPALMTSYPATALLYRNFYVKKAKPSIIEHRTIDSIIARTPPLVSEGAGFDPNRDTIFSFFTKPKTDIELSRIFLEGPIISYYSEKYTPDSRLVEDKNNNTTGKIRSNTGEIIWDYQTGINSLNTPKAQGAVGFLSKQSPLLLDHLSIRSETPYASILLVSLDNLEINVSEKLLLQITTQSNPKGYRTAPKVFKDPHNPKDKNQYDGHVIESLGSMPYMIKNHKMKIAIHSATINSITVTNSNGYPISTVDFKKTSDGIEFTPPTNAIYLVLTKQ